MAERPASPVPVETAIREFPTIRDLLRHGISRLNQGGAFFGHGYGNVVDECKALVAFALSLPMDAIESVLDARLSPDERRVIAELFEQRAVKRLPAAYLTGEAWLAGVCFKCDERALVPRSLIGEAIRNGLGDWLQAHPESILDLCCGAGSLAIIAALAWPEATVAASDLSAAALALARENVEIQGLADRIELIHADLLDGVGGRRFDLIVCNPPYVNARSMGTLPAEYRAEPEMALAAGDDGMDLIRRILASVYPCMNPQGSVLLEIGHEASHFEAAFPRLEFSYVPVAQGESMLVWLTAASVAAMSTGSAAQSAGTRSTHSDRESKFSAATEPTPRRPAGRSKRR